MARPAHALRKAEEFLRNLIRDDPHQPPQGVPALADRAGVAYITMRKAVQKLKAEGVIHGAYRISIGTKPDEQSAPVLPPVRRLEERMIEDLLSGEILQGSRLVTCKELKARYAISAETLRRLLRALNVQKLLTTRGRHYDFISPASPQRPSLVLIAYMQFAGDFELPQLEQDFFRACESACSAAGMVLQLVVARRKGPAMVLTDIWGSEQPLPTGPGIAGYIYLLPHQWAFDEAVLRRTISTRKPLALFDNGWGLAAEHLPTARSARVQIFRATAHTQSGTQAAKYLLAGKHRHLAYISPFHGDTWSQLRYEGARRLISTAGACFSIKLFALPQSMKGGDFANSGKEHSNGGRLFSSIARWRDQAPLSFRDEADALMQNATMLMFFKGELQNAMKPLLDKAISDPKISAWIMANDAAAQAALKFCKSSGIAVPRHIAIVGFDNAIESIERRITSYSFNFEAAAVAMVNFILHPDGAYWKRGSVTVIKGRMIERATG